MPALSVSVVQHFCAHCGRAYELWQNHLALFHRSFPAVLKDSLAQYTWERLSEISQEYSLLQIVKLHDPAVSHGNINLGIDYILTYGGWADPVRIHLDKLATRLNGFASQLKGARNKILSHNDLATIVAGATLGAFGESEGQKYFNNLQEFVNTVHNQVIGGSWRFIDRVRTNDMNDFLTKLKLN